MRTVQAELQQTYDVALRQRQIPGPHPPKLAEVVIILCDEAPAVQRARCGAVFIDAGLRMQGQSELSDKKKNALVDLLCFVVTAAPGGTSPPDERGTRRTLGWSGTRRSSYEACARGGGPAALLSASVHQLQTDFGAHGRAVGGGWRAYLARASADRSLLHRCLQCSS